MKKQVEENGASKKNSFKGLMIGAIVLFFVAGIATIAGKMGLLELGLGTKGMGKAEFKEVTQEELVVTKDWSTSPLNQLVVVLEDGQKTSLAKKIAEEWGGEIVGEMEYLNLYQIAFNTLSEAEFNKKLQEVQAREGVETAFPNMVNVSKELVGKQCSPLKDPVFDQDENRRHYEMIGMGEAWKLIKASKVKLNNVKVGVLDDAVYNGSTEVGGKVKVEGDRTDNPEKDDAGNIVDGGLNHGTMVTHVVGGDADNDGVSGIAGILGDKMSINVKNLYDGVRLARPGAGAEKDATVGTTATGVNVTLKALVYLQRQVESGVKVINCSYGPERPGENNKWINAAYKKFFTKMQKDHPDVIFVAAAGNEARVNGAITSENYFPAGIPLKNVITVGALNNDGTKAAFSNFASGDGEVTISAPGVNIVMGVDKDGKPIKSSGTSFAAPQVTGTIALLQSINPKLTASEIKDILVKSSQGGTINENQSTLIPKGMGAGVLRVDNAVLMVINQMREKEGKEPLKMESLLNMSMVKLTAKGGGTSFKVTAVLPEIADGTASLKITVNGQHAMKGSSSVKVGPNEEATWEIDIADPSVFVKVTRLDTDNCATLNLVQGNYEGNWDSKMTITEDYLIPKIAKMIGESFAEAARDMGCEVSDSGDGTEANAVGTVSELIFRITKQDEAGKNYNLLAEEKVKEEEGIDLSQIVNNMPGVLQEDGSVKFNFERAEDGMTLHSEITLMLVDEKTVEGTMKVYIEGTSENVTFTAADYLAGTIIGTKME